MCVGNNPGLNLMYFFLDKEARKFSFLYFQNTVDFDNHKTFQCAIESLNWDRTSTVFVPCDHSALHLIFARAECFGQK